MKEETINRSSCKLEQCHKASCLSLDSTSTLHLTNPFYSELKKSTHFQLQAIEIELQSQNAPFDEVFTRKMLCPDSGVKQWQSLLGKNFLQNLVLSSKYQATM